MFTATYWSATRLIVSVVCAKPLTLKNVFFNVFKTTFFDNSLMAFSFQINVCL